MSRRGLKTRSAVSSVVMIYSSNPLRERGTNRRAVASVYQSADRLDQRARAGRLGQKVVYAGRTRRQSVVILAAGGEHDHWQLRMIGIGADRVQQRETVHLGHGQVDDR